MYLDDERVTETYPGDRDIAIVFQNLALYPDRTVFNNLAFPLKQQKVAEERRSRSACERRPRTLLRIEHLLKRKPGKLSGGERQRVALGRAIVREPEAYLLDEPISALDALLRLEMRTELKRLQRDVGRTLVYVTHDQVEAMSMADRIVVLRDGVVQQIGAPAEIYHRPANRFVATVVGTPPMNFLPATASWDAGTLRLSHPHFELTAAAAHVRERLPDGAPCFVAVRPEDIHVDTAGEGMAAAVYVLEPLGGETIVDLDFNNRVLKAIAPPTLGLAENQPVRIRLDPRRLHLFAEDGRAVLSAAGDDVFDLTLAT